jgi:hypothetical protein
MFAALCLISFFAVVAYKAWRGYEWHLGNRRSFMEATPRMTNGEIWKFTYRLMFTVDREILNELPLELARLILTRLKAWPHRLAPFPFLGLIFLAGSAVTTGLIIGGSFFGLMR